MSQLIIKCPNCGRKIMEQDGDTIILKDRITLFKKDETISLCKGCHGEVRVPVRIG